MCGITGIFDTRGKGRPPVLHRMNEGQFHRGPDEGGTHIEPASGSATGACRSSTCPPASSRSTTKTSGLRRLQRRNLQPGTHPELQALGHVFHTRSDTGSSSMPGESWGESCVDRFRACSPSPCGTAIAIRYSCPRPARRETLSIRSARRRPAGLRPELKTPCSRRIAARHRPAPSRSIRPGLRAEPRTIFRVKKLCPGAFAPCGAEWPSGPGNTGICAPGRSPSHEAEAQRRNWYAA